MQTNSQQMWLASNKQKLTQQISQHRLPHALLFVGAAGSGKAEMANWLANTISCQHPQMDVDHIAQPCGKCKHCLLIKSNTFPDLKVIDENGSTISVDSIRNASHFLEMTAQISQHKAVILHHAESMSVAASNALLKTLEEPTDGSLLVLTTNNLELLLPTIISRCQLVEIRPNVADIMLASGNFNEPYANVSYLPEINEPQLQQDYITFANIALLAILKETPWPEFEKQFLLQERSLIWLERIIALLIRFYHGADIGQSLDGYLVQQIKENVDIDSLNHIFQLILTTNAQQKEFLQLNAAVAKQQFAISLFTIISSVESTHG